MQTILLPITINFLPFRVYTFLPFLIRAISSYQARHSLFDIDISGFLSLAWYAFKVLLIFVKPLLFFGAYLPNLSWLSPFLSSPTFIVLLVHNVCQAKGVIFSRLSLSLDLSIIHFRAFICPFESACVRTFKKSLLFYRFLINLVTHVFPTIQYVCIHTYILNSNTTRLCVKEKY